MLNSNMCSNYLACLVIFLTFNLIVTFYRYFHLACFMVYFVLNCFLYSKTYCEYVYFEGTLVLSAFGCFLADCTISSASADDVALFG